MRAFLDRYPHAAIRLALILGGPAIVFMGSQALNAGQISYRNAKGQPVPSLFAYWSGWVLVVLAIVPIRVYSWMNEQLEKLE
jgi:hypothetical protein